MVQEKVKVFCFHSVRSVLSIPPCSSWRDPEVYRMFREHLIVESEWFMSFLVKAKRQWGAENVVITFDDAYADVICSAFQSKSMGFRTIVFVSTSHEGSFVTGIPLRIMSQEELRTLHLGGIEIGSHGDRHVDWTKCSESSVRKEIAVSLLHIKHHTDNKGPFVIAPPHGSFTKENAEDAHGIGFSEVYGTLDDFGSERVIKRCLADMNGYIQNKEYGQEPWPWSKS